MKAPWPKPQIKAKWLGVLWIPEVKCAGHLVVGTGRPLSPSPQACAHRWEGMPSMAEAQPALPSLTWSRGCRKFCRVPGPRKALPHLSEGWE